MDAYIYQGDLFCEDCANTLKRQIDRKKPSVDLSTSEDSDDYPQGPHADGGGEADTAQHCGMCNVFLENPLTSHGWNDVKERVAWDIMSGKYNPVSLGTWADFYDVTLKELVEDGLLDLGDVIKLTRGKRK
jgi:hypothetical protein